MMESERKRILDLCSREAKGVATCCLFFKYGDMKKKKVISSKEECRDLEGTRIWTSSTKY